MDQVNAPPPAIPTTVIPGAPWQTPFDGLTTVQPVTTILDTSLDGLVLKIIIDGVPRDIRFYNETAVVFMNMDVPSEICFQNGQRRLTVDGIEATTLLWHETYKLIMIQTEEDSYELGSEIGGRNFIMSQFCLNTLTTVNKLTFGKEIGIIKVSDGYIQFISE